MKLKKKERNGILKAYLHLWKIMSFKDKMACILIVFLSFVSAISKFFPTFAVSMIISKLSNQQITMAGLQFLNEWGTVEVIMFLMGMSVALWVVGMLIYMAIDIYARHMICVVHKTSLNIIFEKRKNNDFHMTNGEVNYIIKNASDNVYSLIEGFFWEVLGVIISLIIVLLQIFLIDVVIGFLTLGVLFLISICVYVRLKFQSPVVNKIEKENAKIGNTLLKSLINLPLIKVLKSQLVEIKELNKQNDVFYKKHKIRAVIGFVYWVMVLAIEYLCLAGIIIFALKRQALVGLSISSIILLINYIIYAYGPIENLGFLMGELQQFAVKICNLMKLHQTETFFENDQTTKVDPECIEVKNLKVVTGDFKRSYSHTFKKGMLSAVFGKSGSGKTSFINSICGIKNYETGEILVDGKPVNNLLENMNVSYAFQDEMLFDRSVKENIYYPNLEETKYSKYLIKKLNLEGIIERESENAEMLNMLSGGEKKRISLVRAMIQNAGVFIFDEPTNELDKKNVKLVIQEIKNLAKNNIVIVISHDSKMLEVCDDYFNLDLDK